MSRVRNLLALLFLLTSFGCKSKDTTHGGDKGCESNDDCDSGYVCASNGECLKLCGVQSDCDDGTICISGTCKEPSSGDRPVINEVVGNDAGDAGKIFNGLIVSGLLLEDAEFELQSESQSDLLEAGDRSDTVVEVYLPAQVESGTYTLVATNTAGSTQAGVVLELPEMSGDWLLDRINSTATDRELDADFLPVGTAAGTVAAGDDSRFEDLADGIAEVAADVETGPVGDLSYQLSGTVQILSGSTDLIGTTGTTMFTTELRARDILLLDDEIVTVASITDDENLVLTAPAASAHGADTPIPFYTDPDLFVVRNSAGISKVWVDKTGKLGIGGAPDSFLTVAPGPHATTHTIAGSELQVATNVQAVSGRTAYGVIAANSYLGGAGSTNAAFHYIHPFDAANGTASYKVFRIQTGTETGDPDTPAAALKDRFWVDKGGSAYFGGSVSVGGTTSHRRQYSVHADNPATLLDRHGNAIPGNFVGLAFAGTHGTSAEGNSLWMIKKQPDGLGGAVMIEQLDDPASNSNMTPIISDNAGTVELDLYTWNGGNMAVLVHLTELW